MCYQPTKFAARVARKPLVSSQLRPTVSPQLGNSAVPTVTDTKQRLSNFKRRPTDIGTTNVSVMAIVTALEARTVIDA